MAVVGGFLGGGVEMVPAGQMQVLLQWNTEDRLNIEGAVFTLTGTNGTYTANGDASGRAEVIVPAGQYTISVKHSGSYANDDPQRLIGEGAQSYLVLFDAYTRISGITFTADLPIGTTYSIKNNLNVIVASGTYSNPLVFSASGGDYTLVLSTMGQTVEHPFIIEDLPISDDLKGSMCEVTFANMPEGTNVVFDGSTIFTSMIRASSLTMPRMASIALNFTTSKSYSNGVFPFTSSSMTINTAGLSELVVEIPIASTANLITADNPSFTVPFTGKYRVFAIGGGGGCFGTVDNAGGAGSGHMAYEELDLMEGQVYPILIGGGAKSGETAGGITSFGTLVSVSGGNSTSSSSSDSKFGGAGGAGGGGSQLGAGGNGDFGGGGGGGGGISYNTSIAAGHGGDGGPYGGGGGGGGDYKGSSGGDGGTYGGRGGGGGKISSAATRFAENGTDTTDMDLPFKGNGLAGSYIANKLKGGGGGGGFGGNGGASTGMAGGGGGGFGGKGGNGDSSNDLGGGGGGGFGGKGGNGNGKYGGGGGGYGTTPSSQRANSRSGYSGEGYGSGAGGCYNTTQNGRDGCVVVWMIV